MKPVFVLFAVVLQLSLCGQSPASFLHRNLVPNASFENYRRASQDVRKATPWRPIETIDYYQQPLKNDTTYDKGAFDGSCYVGFRFRKKYKEFLQVRLVEPLHRGTIYEVRIHLRLAFWSNATLRSFGVLFTKGGYRGQVDVTRGSLVDTTCLKGGLMHGFRWFEVHGYYKADGGEKYITIGNFSPEIKKDMVRMNALKMGFKESYYFLDEVSVTRAQQFEEKIAEQRIGPSYDELMLRDSTLAVNENIAVGENIPVNNIAFEDNRYYLLPESYTELNKLARYLLLHPAIQIRINGYSDESSFAFMNQRMSELRAREVFEYLISKGVQNKMTFAGMGAGGGDQGSVHGRERRVEFEILKK